jgi:hypothetical protein
LSDEQEKISAEVDEQLEYLFAESGGGEGGTEEEAKTDPLRELKAVFLAVDWEINDEIMSAMLRQIDSLKKIFAKDRIVVLFLQLLGAVGKYIKAQKANAHPDAVKLLNSIYTSLEIVSMSEGMTETERKRILRSEVKRFQSLKEELARRKQPAQKTPETAAKSVAEPKAADTEVPPALRYVLEEIRKTIRSEFAALRDELKS